MVFFRSLTILENEWVTSTRHAEQCEDCFESLSELAKVLQAQVPGTLEPDDDTLAFSTAPASGNHPPPDIHVDTRDRQLQSRSWGSYQITRHARHQQHLISRVWL